LMAGTRVSFRILPGILSCRDFLRVLCENPSVDWRPITIIGPRERRSMPVSGVIESATCWDEARADEGGRPHPQGRPGSGACLEPELAESTRRSASPPPAAKLGYRLRVRSGTKGSTRRGCRDPRSARRMIGDAWSGAARVRWEARHQSGRLDPLRPFTCRGNSRG
jgi:hypothetical protein